MTIRPGQLEEMKDKAYRHGMVNAQIEIDLPLQIRALRRQRGWTQPKLATEAEMKQPRISNVEKPGGVHFTLETLRRLAEAFDVALIVRFAPFSELLTWSHYFSPDGFVVPSFDDELGELEIAAITPQKKVEAALSNLLVNIGEFKAKKEQEQGVIASAAPIGNVTRQGIAGGPPSGAAETPESAAMMIARIPPQSQPGSGASEAWKY